MRRVVAGLGENGRSQVLSDGPSPAIREISQGGANPGDPLPDVPATLEDGQYITAGLWVTDPSPDPRAPDPAAAPIRLPAPGQTRWLLSVMGPNMNWPPHRTNTIDYGAILTGECDLVLDDDVVHLVPGDFVVINGVAHGWRTGPQGCTKSTVVVGYEADEAATLEGTAPTSRHDG